MRASIAQRFMGYQGTFAIPLFDWAKQAGELQRRIYEAIYSCYPYALDAADVNVSTGDSARDPRLFLAMFSGNASIELTPAALELDFRNLNNDADFYIGKQCINLTLRAVREVCADVVISTETITTTFFLHPIHGGAMDHLAAVAAPNIGIDPSSVGATEQYPVIAVELGNPTEQWHATANVTVSHQGASLCVFCQTEYAENSDCSLDYADHQHRLIVALLSRIQVEVE